MTNSLEISPDQERKVQTLAENSSKDPANFKEGVKTLTENELNALAAILGKKTPVQTTDQNIRSAIQARLEILDTNNMAENLEQLTARLPAIAALLAGPKTSNQHLDQSINEPFSVATNWIKGQYTSMIEKAEKLPIIGGFIKGLSFENLQRSYFRTLASLYKSPTAEMVAVAGTAASTGVLGGLFTTFSGNFIRETILNPMGLSGQIGLMKMELSEAIAQYSKQEDIIAYDPALDAPDIDALLTVRSKDPSLSTNTLVKTFIEKNRAQTSNQPLKLTITIVNLLKDKIKPVDAQAATVQKKLTIVANPAWKEIGVTTVNFGTECKIVNGILTIPDNAVTQDGTPVIGSVAKTLVTTKIKLTHAKEVSILEKSDNPMTLDLQNLTASITSENAVDLDTLNKILNLGSTNFRYVEILDNNLIRSTQARVFMKNGFRVVHTQRNSAVLKAIASRKLDSLVADKTNEQKFDLKADESAFTLVTASTPVTTA